MNLDFKLRDFPEAMQLDRNRQPFACVYCRKNIKDDNQVCFGFKKMSEGGELKKQLFCYKTASDGIPCARGEEKVEKMLEKADYD